MRTPWTCFGVLIRYSAYCDNSTAFVPATFARPTIVNGNVYVPTYGQITKAGNPSCTSSAPCSGVIVYVHNP
jgi:hypothetical protein